MPNRREPLDDTRGSVAASALARVLVIDDDDIARSVLRRLIAGVPEIELCGEAATGEQGLLELARCEPDIVVIDWSMAEADGVETTARVRARDTAVHVIGWTSTGDQAVAQAFRGVGATAVYAKHQTAALVSHLRRLARR